MVEFQLLPFSTCTTGAGNIGGGGVIFGGMEEEEEEVVEEGGPGGIGQGGGGEQQPPQLVQDRGAAVLLALPYGFMVHGFDAVGLPSVNSGTKSIQGPLTETRCPRPPVGGEGIKRSESCKCTPPSPHLTVETVPNPVTGCCWAVATQCVSNMYSQRQVHSGTTFTRSNNETQQDWIQECTPLHKTDCFHNCVF